MTVTVGYTADVSFQRAESRMKLRLNRRIPLRLCPHPYMPRTQSQAISLVQVMQPPK